MANTDNPLDQPLSTEAKRDFPFTGSPLQDALDGASVASQTHSSEAAESARIPLELFAAVAVVMVAVAGAALFYYSHEETMRSGTHLAKAAEVADAGVVANLAERFQRIFLSKGMDGVSEDIRGCYAASTADTSALVEKTRACMLYDLAAAGFDRGFRQEFAIINPGVAIAPIAFLEPKTYDERIARYAKVAFAGWSNADIDRYVGDAPTIISTLPLSPSHHEEVPVTVTGDTAQWNDGPLPAGMEASKDYQVWKQDFGVEHAVRHADIHLVKEQRPVVMVQEPTWASSGFAHLLMIRDGQAWRELTYFRGGFIFNGPSHGGNVNDLVLYYRNGGDYSRITLEYVLSKHAYVFISKMDIPGEMADPNDRYLDMFCWFWSLQGGNSPGSTCGDKHKLHRSSRR